MPEPTKPVGPKFRLVVDTSKAPRLDPAAVAKALGADPVPVARMPGGGSPMSRFAMRMEVFKRIHAAAQASDADGARREPVAFTGKVWHLLEKLAVEANSQHGSALSANDLAGLLVSVAVEGMGDDPAPILQQLMARVQGGQKA